MRAERSGSFGGIPSSSSISSKDAVKRTPSFNSSKSECVTLSTNFVHMSFSSFKVFWGGFLCSFRFLSTKGLGNNFCLLFYHLLVDRCVVEIVVCGRRVLLVIFCFQIFFFYLCVYGFKKAHVV